MFTNFPESRQDRLDSLGSERGKNNKGRMLLVHLRRSGSSPRVTQRTRTRDSRMSEGEKKAPHGRRAAHPRVVCPARPDRARGMRSLALIATVTLIMYSAFADNATKQEILRKGISELVSKSESFDVLVGRARGVLYPRLPDYH